MGALKTTHTYCSMRSFLGIGLDQSTGSSLRSQRLLPPSLLSHLLLPPPHPLLSLLLSHRLFSCGLLSQRLFCLQRMDYSIKVC